jgi:glycosyltransferase involved in cell wall biosynthesis
MIDVSTRDLVSVAVPAYNAAGTIVDTIRSVCAQSYPDLEIIVVDDGSTDETAAKVDRLALEDSRIQLLRRRNGGVARARNVALAAAKGAYICFLDADDLLHPDKIALEVAALRHAGPEVGMAYSWFWRIDEQSRLLPDPPVCHDFFGEAFAACLLQTFVLAPTFRAEAIRAIGGYTEDVRIDGCEDLDCYLRLSEHFDVVNGPRVLIGYRQSRLSKSRDVKAMRSAFGIVMARARRRHPELPARIFHAAEALCYLYHAKRAGRDGIWSEVAACLTRAFIKNPVLTVEVALEHLFPRKPAPAAGLIGQPFLPPPPELDRFKPAEASPLRKRLKAYASSLAIQRPHRVSEAGETVPAARENLPGRVA